MPEYRFQRFRGGWAITAYEHGERVSRCRLESLDEAAARREFAERLEELTRPRREPSPISGTPIGTTAPDA